MSNQNNTGLYHSAQETSSVMSAQTQQSGFQISYAFNNFFHPFVGNLIERLNQTSVAEMLDPAFLRTLASNYEDERDYTLLNQGVKVNLGDVLHDSPGSDGTYGKKTIDVSTGGPYANYNWELVYHVPMMIAVHLSNNQRFAEAQKWFHYVFDPTDAHGPWKCFAFCTDTGIQTLNSLLQLLSTPDNRLPSQKAKDQKNNVVAGYNSMLQNPFQPHVVARTRQWAYQWYVVMKYLDNLIAWGDSLFLQNTIETINEATLCYVAAANILGPRPQAMPWRGTVKPKNFLQMKQAGLNKMGNAMVALEGQFPWNLVSVRGPSGSPHDQSGALFGIGRALYFCIPPNQKLLSYWDIVADRLFKIRNSQNIQGVVQQLPLFDPPLDPGMLVKAAAAGIDVGSIVSGLNQPIGPVRAPLLIQKSLELAGEVRALGNTLLSAIEKGDVEQLSLLRQGHELALHQMVQNVRFLQWRHAQEATNALLKTRLTTLERYTYYLRLLGLNSDPKTVPSSLDTIAADRQRGLTLLTTGFETNFDTLYSELVTQYDKPIVLQQFPQLVLAENSSPSNQAGATGQGQLHLVTNEDAELNTFLPAARDDAGNAATKIRNSTNSTRWPSVSLSITPWWIGFSTQVFDGTRSAAQLREEAEGLQTDAAVLRDQAGIASRTSSYQRRADDWILQANLAARELMQIGRQIIGSLIAEQVAYHDYKTVMTQATQSQEVLTFLQGTTQTTSSGMSVPGKVTNTTFYIWMQSELSRLYYQYYRFACDIARKAEQTMKRELMRPELDQTSFIEFSYWDSGKQGLLSGEKLHLAIKRLEMAYHDSNKRELELTRHVSMRQLDPLALLALKITGSCTVDIPEWLYDRDCPGVYMRRIKSVSLSVPSVVGPYASINCTLSLQRSTVRKSPLLNNGVYARDTSGEDDRFIDYYGATDVIVTSSGTNDSGMFETNLRDERFLPFEGAGAISTWTLSLPSQLRSFDYMTISDVILHIRYTARQAGDPLGAAATKELITMLDTAGQSRQALMFSLRYDFPTEWSAFVNGSGTFFTATLQKNYFPYIVQSAKQIIIDALTLYAPSASGKEVVSVTPQVDLGSLSIGLSSTAGVAPLSLSTDDAVLNRNKSRQVFLVLQYHFSF